MFRKHGPSIVQQISVLKTIIFLSVLMIAFAISYAGEGHVIRSSFLPQTTAAFKMIVLLKAVIKMVFMFLPVKLLIAIPLSLPWFFLGANHSFLQVTGRSVLAASVLLLLLTVTSLIPLSFVMSEMGPERAWTQVSIYITFYSAFVAVWLGKMFRSFVMLNVISIALVTVITVVILVNGTIVLINESNYVSAYDQRMEILYEMRAANRNDLLILDPLPRTRWLHSAEISVSPDHFTNRHLKNYLKLDFDIKKAE
jgi:hypothetical protein